MQPRRPRDLTQTMGMLIEAGGYLQRLATRDVVAETGLDGARFETLMRLRRAFGGSARVTQLATRVSFPLSSFSRLVDGMERDGLLERKPDPTHRRAVLITATPAGDELLDSALSAWIRSGERRVQAVLTDSELDQLEILTRKVRDANLPD